IGYVPRLWKRANIAPIPKSDRGHSICKNYGPISLLSGVGKLLEKIITMRLMWYLNEKRRMYWWLDSFLKDRIGQVVLNGINSIEDPIQCGLFADDHIQDEDKKIPKDESSFKQYFDHVKYLGLIVDQQMTFQQQINYVYGKAEKKLGFNFPMFYK
ncbi:hypothetical protein RFI_31054, partial [Reticulomyxa filosa]